MARLRTLSDYAVYIHTLHILSSLYKYYVEWRVGNSVLPKTRILIIFSSLYYLIAHKDNTFAFISLAVRRCWQHCHGIILQSMVKPDVYHQGIIPLCISSCMGSSATCRLLAVLITMVCTREAHAITNHVIISCMKVGLIYHQQSESI